MDDKRFWSIIKRARAEADGDTEAVGEIVLEQLVEMPPADIAAFDAQLRGKLDAANTWALWGAAYWMNGGCSDDGFVYFRAWLVAKGQKAYEAALNDPDSLAKLDGDEEEEYECEGLLDAADQAYRAATGEPLPERVAAGPAAPAGEPWDFDDADASATRLPKIVRRFGGA